jgi:hypothetical protein
VFARIFLTLLETAFVHSCGLEMNDTNGEAGSMVIVKMETNRHWNHRLLLTNCGSKHLHLQVSF